MLGKNTDRNQAYEFVLLDDLVPDDHLVRKLEKHIDFQFIYDLVEPLYCKDNGRPSIDPVVLFKMVFISYLFGIRSMRRTVEEVQLNMAYRWFLGLRISEPVPHFSTFGKNYERRFKNTTVFQEIFDEIVRQALAHGLIDAEEFFTDSTHLKANANKKKFNKGHVHKDAKKYTKELTEEINAERKRLGKAPIDDHDDDDETPPPSSGKKGKGEIKERKVSRTDPESGYLYRTGKPEGFYYLEHRTVDGKANVIIDSHVTPGNVHDTQPFIERVHSIHQRFGFWPKVFALDAGYVSNAISHFLVSNNIYAVFGYKRKGALKGAKGYPKKRFLYVAMHDYFVCPEEKLLTYRNIRKDGLKEYRPDRGVCQACPRKTDCLSPSQKTKLLTRHLWEDAYDVIMDNKRSVYGKNLYRRRGETVERSFADSKELHTLRYIRYRGLKKATMQTLLTSACQNMKKIANYLDRRDGSVGASKPIRRFFAIISNIFDLKTKTPILVACG